MTRGLLDADQQTSGSVYTEYRALCSAPMVCLETLDAGGLWLYDGFSSRILACLGERSLLVAYDVNLSRADVIAGFNRTYDCLVRRQARCKTVESLVLAALEDSSGDLFVPHFLPGDWVGLVNHVPLPPTKNTRPSRWGRSDRSAWLQDG